MGNQSAAFEQLTSTLTVRTVYRPIPEWTYFDPAVDEASYALGHPSLPVKIFDHNDNHIGFVFPDDIEEENRECVTEGMERLDLRGKMETIKPSDYISSNTTIIEAFSLLSVSERTHFYVIDKTDHFGILRFPDLTGSIGRIALFSLAIETHEVTLKLCRLPHSVDKGWDGLSRDRKKRLISNQREVYRNKQPQELNRDEKQHVLRKANLRDLAHMIWWAQLLAYDDLAEIRYHFDRLNELRDLCAHPNSDVDLEDCEDRSKLFYLIKTITGLKEEIDKVYADKLLDSL